MDIVRSCLVAAVVGLVGLFVMGALIAPSFSPQQIESPGGQITTIGIPTFILFTVMAAVAALVHPQPHRSQAGRHAVAVVFIPGVFLVLTLITSSSSASLTAVSFVFGAAGALVGWQLVDRIRNSRQHGKTGYPY